MSGNIEQKIVLSLQLIQNSPISLFGSLHLSSNYIVVARLPFSLFDVDSQLVSRTEYPISEGCPDETVMTELEDPVPRVMALQPCVEVDRSEFVDDEGVPPRQGLKDALWSYRHSAVEPCHQLKDFLAEEAVDYSGRTNILIECDVVFQSNFELGSKRDVRNFGSPLVSSGLISIGRHVLRGLLFGTGGGLGGLSGRKRPVDAAGLAKGRAGLKVLTLRLLHLNQEAVADFSSLLGSLSCPEEYFCSELLGCELRPPKSCRLAKQEFVADHMYELDFSSCLGKEVLLVMGGEAASSKSSSFLVVEGDRIPLGLEYSREGPIEVHGDGENSVPASLLHITCVMAPWIPSDVELLGCGKADTLNSTASNCMLSMDPHQQVALAKIGCCSNGTPWDGADRSAPNKRVGGEAAEMGEQQADVAEIQATRATDEVGRLQTDNEVVSLDMKLSRLHVCAPALRRPTDHE
ncbi:uncharacterized protein BDR25DRAFT_354048 [Lindgomyces ingoldianus]|uniref:Uncharacterized protein n=1 Tax=Lindgomyces ingoldianus TaxID=673940 RepID=A0ACB6QX79_9PLEO|nr:uncharacterized protein BDR25DRAFT_354048 [Lindgomyces ingoldianus]KAF2471511.1 hypothetical protein BDR25DRAFT_354048 [Lindgomyces ingoldianus]